jgi:hypothetical protein
LKKTLELDKWYKQERTLVLKVSNKKSGRMSLDQTQVRWWAHWWRGEGVWGWLVSENAVD